MCPHRTSAAARVARNWLIRLNAKVAELADAPDLGSGGATHEGSNPSFRTSLASAFWRFGRHREGDQSGRMTPTLFSIWMMVPYGSERRCRRSRMTRAVWGEARRGTPLRVRRMPYPRSTGYRRISDAWPLS